MLKFLLIYYFVFIINILYLNCKAESVKKNCTLLLPHKIAFENTVLKRRTRGYFFPPSSFFVTTAAIGKAVIDGRPGGLLYSYEIDALIELPSYKDFDPQLLINKLNGPEDEEPVSVPVPVPAPAEPPKVIEPVGTPYLDPLISLNTSIPADHYSWPGVEYFNTDYGNIIGSHEYPFHGHEAETWYGDNFWNTYSHDHFQDRNYRKYSKQPLRKSHNKKLSPHEAQQKVYKNTKSVPHWKYHQGYRERREIFQRLEAVGKIFGINMKACIQRAICELTTFLKPYGESLMEDILRIILTLPTDQYFEDDYSEINRRRKTIDCVRHFAVTCPYSILEILTMNIKQR